MGGPIKQCIRTIIDNYGMHSVSRNAKSESRVAFLVEQAAGRLHFWITVNRNGAFSVEVRESESIHARTLIDALIVADRAEVNGVKHLEIRKVNHDPLMERERLEAERDTEYEHGFYTGKNQGAKKYASDPSYHLYGRSERFCEGFRAGVMAAHMEYMRRVESAIGDARVDRIAREEREERAAQRYYGTPDDERAAVDFEYQQANQA